MKFKKGENVIIVKALDDDEYYYGGYVGQRLNSSRDIIPLKTKAVVLHSDSDEVRVELPNGRNFSFHPRELKKIEVYAGNLGRMPDQYIFSLSSQLPTLLLNDRMYVVNEEDKELYKNFLKVNNTKYNVVESASLKSLEEITYTHNAKEFENLESKFLEGVVEESKEILTKTGKEYVLMDFIVNEVFPYFRGSGDRGKIEDLLGEKAPPKEKKIEKPTKTISSKRVSDLEKYISKIVKKIENEKFSEPKKVRRKSRKLDDLLGYANIDLTKRGKDYDPESLLGNILEGENAAIIEGDIYKIVQGKGRLNDTVLNLEGKDYIFLLPEPLSKTKEKYYFELSKNVRINALNKLFEKKSLQDLMQSDYEVEDLVGRKEYSEGNFGFIKMGNQSSPFYYFFLKVPEHVLKDPDEGGYYHFKSSRVAVKLYVNSSGKVTYEGPKMVERMSHPFSSNTCHYASICMGDYKYSSLGRLKRGEAIAKLLTDTKHTLLSGYVDEGTEPERSLYNYTSNKLSLREVEKKGLPITNINLLHRGRRRETRW